MIELCPGCLLLQGVQASSSLRWKDLVYPCIGIVMVIHLPCATVMIKQSKMGSSPETWINKSRRKKHTSLEKTAYLPELSSWAPGIPTYAASQPKVQNLATQPSQHISQTLQLYSIEAMCLSRPFAYLTCAHQQYDH